MRPYSLVKNVTLTLICLLLVIPSVIYLYPPLVSAEGSYIVLSGSMSPALNPGDLVFVKHKAPAAIEVDDVVTVKTPTGFFTHRVFEKKFEDGVYLFKTKGDANEDPDPMWMDASQIVGKTVFTIPLGHLYSPYGYILSFLVPCVLLVGLQMHHIFSLFKRRSKRELRRWRRKKHPVLDTTSVLLLLILVMSGSWLMAPYFQLGSFSYFSDWETSIGNTFRAAETWPGSFYADGCGCIRLSPPAFGCGNLTSDGKTIILKVKDESKSLGITGYESKIGLNENICDLLERFNQTKWYQKIVAEMGPPDEWVVETYYGQSDTEELKVKVFNGEYVFSYSYDPPLTLRNVKSFFVGKIPEKS